MTQRRVRRLDKHHADFIRELPCIICRDNISTECCHIRMSDGRISKPPTGIGIRPDDRFTVPMCSKHHREQHAGSERKFWDRYNIDAVLIALALYSISGDVEEAERIIEAYIAPIISIMSAG